MRLSILLILLAAATSVQGQVGEFFEPRLLPIYADLERPIPGAFGSLWATELWVHNASDTVVTLHHRGGCIPVQPNQCPAEEVGPGVTKRITIDEDYGRAGAMIGIHPIAASDDVHFSLLLRNLAAGDGEVTYIPVVAEDEYFVKPVEFVRVVIHESERLTLRVYDPRATASGEFLVQLYDMEGGILAEEVVRTWTDAYGVEGNWVPNPQVASSDLRRLLPIPLPEAVRIRVTPLVAGLEYWVLLSATENATQEVEIIRAD